EAAARDRDLRGSAAADRGRADGRDRRRLRGAAGDDLQDVAGGVVHVLCYAPLLVDDADESAERVIVVALLAGVELWRADNADETGKRAKKCCLEHCSALAGRTRRHPSFLLQRRPPSGQCATFYVFSIRARSPI